MDKNADEYRLLNPVLARLDKSKSKPKVAAEKMEEIVSTFF